MTTFGSLFAGIGGFDLGLQRAGFAAAWQVEIDAACQRVLARRWPTVLRLQDVTRTVAADLDAVDLVCGGFPCQDVSVAGRRAGLAGDRSGLWFDFHRLVAAIAPRWILVENVPGLLSSNGGRDFAVVAGGLVELGYGVAWRILDAQYFGVPQRRRRVFIVGSLGGAARSAAVLFEPESSGGSSPPRRQKGAIASGDLARSVGGVGGGQDFGANKGTLVFAKAKRAQSEEDDETWHESEVANTLNAHDVGDTRATELVAYSIYPEGGQGADLVATPTRVAPAIAATDGERTTERGLRLVDPGSGIRRLTPIECERLQGFPDGWTAPESDSARYRMLGNAVCVPVAEWIARRILAADG